jgi:beta-glucosidase
MALNCRFLFATLLLALAFPLIAHADPNPTYLNPKAPLSARVDDLYGRLTEQEKLSLLSGTDFTSQPLPGLKLAGISFADAGQGVRGGPFATAGPATAFPAESTMASSWDVNLLWQIGQTIGDEARNKGTGTQIELAPAVNIHRTPVDGRNSEYMGEDPYLTSNLAVAYIDGMQSTGVGACIKHFACNNQETDRLSISSVVDERTLREIYLPSFEAAVTKAHVAAVMAAYNRVNGQFCTANWYLLTNVLRNEWHYPGLVISDWGAVHDIAPVVNAGLDVEMPGQVYLKAASLQSELNDGDMKQTTVDTVVKHILRAMIVAGLADPVASTPNPAEVGSPEHVALATKVAEEGMVLLKNDRNLLPLNPKASQRIAVFGVRATSWQIDSDGSPAVTPTQSVDALDGIKQRIAGNPDALVDYIAGDNPRSWSQVSAAARKADTAIVIVGSEHETEGTDRSTMAISSDQVALIKAVSAANPNTVVVLNNGGPVTMQGWISKVPAVLDAGFPGEMGGVALASILFGDIDPSGKLVDTYGVRRQDYPDYANYPGSDGKVVYAEGIYVGYRGFDKHHIAPLFPFGYGLSYTKFRYSNLQLTSPRWNAQASVTASAKITNIGERSGAEVVELYIQPKAPLIDRPLRELKGFAKVDLAPGESKNVTFTLVPRDFAYCDVPGKQWRADRGLYEVELAASSRDIRLTEPLKLTRTWTQSIPEMGAKNPNPIPVQVSLSTGQPATCSSVMHDNLAKYAFDGDPTTRWESQWSDPQWIEVDLGTEKTISRVRLMWETAYGSEYSIQASDDNINWRTVYSTSTGQGSLENIQFSPTTARYVRLYGTKRGTQFGYSLYSFDIYSK